MMHLTETFRTKVMGVSTRHCVLLTTCQLVLFISSTVGASTHHVSLQPTPKIDIDMTTNANAVYNNITQYVLTILITDQVHLQ